MTKTVITTPAEFEAWLPGCADAFGLDFETTGLNYLEMEVVGLSLRYEDQVAYLDLWGNPHQDELLEAVKQLIESDSLFIMHHAKYDLKCSQKFLGVQPKHFFCTFIASFLLDENKESHSLKALAKSILAVPEAQISKWEDADACGRHSEEFYEYAMNDSIWAYQLWEIFAPELKKQELEHVFKIEMDFLPVCAEMEMNGVLVDQTKLKALEIKISNKMESLEDSMLEMVGKKADLQTGLFGQGFRTLPVNFNSAQQLVGCLRYLGLELKEKTAKKKELTVNVQTLERL